MSGAVFLYLSGDEGNGEETIDDGEYHDESVGMVVTRHGGNVKHVIILGVEKEIAVEHGNFA